MIFEMKGNTEKPKNCNCDTKIDDGYFDLSCPVHDKQTSKLTHEERQLCLKRILEYAETLNW